MNNIDFETFDNWRKKSNSETFEYIDASASVGDAFLSRVYRTTTSFLNTSGGTIIVFCSAEGRYRHYEVINLGIDTEINPRPNVEVNFTRVSSDINLLIIDIPVGYERPYSHNGDILLRKGESVYIADRQEILRLLGEHEDPNTRWERQILTMASEGDLNQERIYECFKREEISRAIQNLRPTDDDSPIWALLKYFNLGKRSRLRNSAIALFGKNPTEFFPQLAIRTVAYESEEADASRIIDEKTLGRNMLSNIEECLFFCERHTSFSSSFPTERDMSFQRSLETSYPFAAVREAILNAIVHRDFVFYETNVTIKILPNRIEIWNPGSFPPGTNLEKLEDFRVSRPRNPDIAYVLQKMGFIERLGSGINRIIKLFEQHGLPRPRWEEVGGGVRVTLNLKTDSKSQSIKIAHLIAKELEDGEVISQKRLASIVNSTPDLIDMAIARLVEAGILIATADKHFRFHGEHVWRL